MQAANWFGIEDFCDLLSQFSVFESTIRYIAGLISAYELSGKQYPALINKAKELGDKLAYAWVGVRQFVFFIIQIQVLKYGYLGQRYTFWSPKLRRQ